MSAAENDAMLYASRRDALKGAAALTIAFWMPGRSAFAQNGNGGTQLYMEIGRASCRERV